ncbi:hypothetical protein ACJX0J_016196, partial [Zea mays]
HLHLYLRSYKTKYEGMDEIASNYKSCEMILEACLTISIIIFLYLARIVSFGAYYFTGFVREMVQDLWIKDLISFNKKWFFFTFIRSIKSTIGIVFWKNSYMMQSWRATSIIILEWLQYRDFAKKLIIDQNKRTC